MLWRHPAQAIVHVTISSARSPAGRVTDRRDLWIALPRSSFKRGGAPPGPRRPRRCRACTRASGDRERPARRRSAVAARLEPPLPRPAPARAGSRALRRSAAAPLPRAWAESAPSGCAARRPREFLPVPRSKGPPRRPATRPPARRTLLSCWRLARSIDRELIMSSIGRRFRSVDEAAQRGPGAPLIARCALSARWSPVAWTGAAPPADHCRAARWLGLPRFGRVALGQAPVEPPALARARIADQIEDLLQERLQPASLSRR